MKSTQPAKRRPITTMESREQFIVSRQLATTVQSVDSLYSTNLQGVDEVKPKELDGIAEYVANQCSAWQIENTLTLLHAAYNKKET